MRLPPPRSLEELVSTADVVVTAQVTGHLGRRTPSADGTSYDEEAVELTVVEYLKGIGPPSLLVRQAVSPEDTQGLAYAFTVPPVGSTGFFFLARDRATGDWTAYFGPAGRILEGPAGAAILDREELPQPAFLAGKSMADVDRDLRRLLSEP